MNLLSYCIGLRLALKETIEVRSVVRHYWCVSQCIQSHCARPCLARVVDRARTLLLACTVLSTYLSAI